MSEINTTKFYQFLSQYQADGGWENVADKECGNGDGTVIKSEFRNFLNENWNGEENGELSNDLINSFWKKIDTNTSANKITGTKLKNLNALDKKESEKLEKRLELQIQLDDFIASNAQIPSALSSMGSQWKADVTEELAKIVDSFIAGGAEGDCTQLLAEAYPSIANKATAQYCAIEYQETLMKDVLANYPDYKVADDKTLQGLINAYLGTVNGETDPGTIKDEVINIVDAYLATAGLKDGSAYPLEDLGFDANKLNDIQLAVIAQTIKNDLSAEAQNYKGFEAEFEVAIQQFIESTIKEGGSFEELKASAPKFAESKFKTELDNHVAISTTYKDVTEGSNFYNKLVAEYGQTLADKIAKNDKYLKAYQEIVNDLLAKVKAGELAMDGAESFMLEQIGTNLNKFFANGLADMNLTELNNVYDKLVSSAEAQADTDAALQQHREAAIAYCDAISKKGALLKEAAGEIFGSADYKSVINNMLPAEIQEAMADLKAKALEIGDVSTFTVGDWSGIDESYDLVLGSEITKNISVKINNGDSEIDTSRISYEVVATGGCSATVDTYGSLNIKASNTAGRAEVKIYAVVDGVKIGEPKIIKIANKDTLDAGDFSRINGWGGATADNLLTYTGEGQAGDHVTNVGFADLYNQDRIVRLHIGMDHGGDDYKKDVATMTTKLDQLGNCIYGALSTIGLNNDVLRTATNNVIERYKANVQGNADDDGTSAQDLTDNVIWYMNGNRESTGHKVWRTCDNDGKDSNVWAVRFKDVVDDIMAEYNKLV